MRDSNVANAAKESAQTKFSHGLQDICNGPQQPVDRHIGASFRGAVLTVAAVGVGQIEEVII
jgi:hypothetical protein